MNNSEETLDQPTSTDAILQAIAELSQKIDDYKKESDAQFAAIQNRFESVDVQFEAIRQGIVHNDVSYDRLKAEVLLLRADVKELSEEIRQNKKVLV
jgi:peptidoglycan hydrolase CwlO-like protein